MGSSSVLAMLASMPTSVTLADDTTQVLVNLLPFGE